MKRLSPEQFHRARHFLKTAARPLDRALFEHRFEDAPIEHVTAKLAGYQNDDGGFGHALEPDVRTPTSSALATGIAVTILRELQCSPEHPMVTGAVQYLRDTFDDQNRVWRVIPHDVNHYPHAPWWHDEDGSLAHAFDDFLVIPRAQLLGLLHHYSTLVPTGWLDVVTEATVTAVQELDDEAFGGGGDTLRYALDLLEADALPRRFGDRLAPRLRRLTDQIVCRDPEQWSSYCPTPLKLAPSPETPVVDVLGDDLQRNLDYQIDHQTAEGTWEPTWSWGGSYPEAWRQAKREWRGHLTLETLTSLHAFGRVRL